MIDAAILEYNGFFKGFSSADKRMLKDDYGTVPF